MDDIDLSQLLGGRLRKEGAQAQAGTTRTVVATATSDSASGLVDVVLPGESVTADGRIQVPASTTVDVRKGDPVQVNVANGSPVVIGVIGGGDRTRADIDLAKKAAEEAKKVTDDAIDAAGKAQDAADAANKTAQDLSESTQKALDEVTQIANGAASAAGGAVKSVDVEYALGDSQTQAPTSGWSTTAPAWQAGKFMWQRTKVTPVSGEPTYSAPTCIQGAAGKDGADGTGVTIKGTLDSSADLPAGGADGDAYLIAGDLWVWTGSGWDNVGRIQGPAGADGTDGRDGTTYYLHVAYANSSDGRTNFSTTDPDRSYMGQCVDTNSADPTTPGVYSWSLIRGRDGADGAPGPAGKDGEANYFHVAYATSSDGRQGFSTTVAAGKTYIGTYVDGSSADSDDPSVYAWSLIKGADGADGTPGRDGADGTTYYLHRAYADSADGAQGFSTKYADGKTYMGTCVNTTSPDPTTPSSYTWARFRGVDGADGADGSDGRGVRTIVEQYYLSTSSTSQVGGSWSASQPAWQKGRWIWTRSVVTWTDGSVTYTSPVLAAAINGANEAAQAVASHVWENSAGLHVSTNEKPASGDDTGRNVLLNALGVLLRNATTVLGSFTGSGIVLYDGDGTPRLSITGSGVQMLDADGKTEVAHFAANTQLGKAAGKHIVLDAANGIVLMDGDAILGSFNPSAMTVGNTSGLHLATTADGIGIYQGSTLLALFGPTSVQLGANSASSVVSMCGGKGSIEYRKDYFATGSDAFVITADALVNLLSDTSTVRMLASPANLETHGAVQASKQHVSIGVGDGSSEQFGAGGYIDLTATQLMLKSANVGFYTAGYYAAMRDWVKQTGLSGGLMTRRWASGRASYRGTTVITPNGQSAVVWTASQFSSLFGAYTSGQTHVSFFNGDAGANTFPVCAGYRSGDGAVLALFPQAVSGSYRVDFMVEN